MNSKTQSQINTIKAKVKDPFNGGNAFKTNDDVIATAVDQFFNTLKQGKFL